MIKNSDLKKHKKKELEAINLVKKQEAERTENGWVWMSLNRKTKKHVHPDRINQLIKDGWKRSSGS